MLGPSRGLCWIEPGWSAPPPVRALTTTRIGGVSTAPYDGLNLALHVADDAQAVMENRCRLIQAADLPAEPGWLRQVHGTRVIEAHCGVVDAQADGSCTSARGVVCAVLTADCLPLFLASRQGDRVGLLHVGWRGLAAGIVEKGIEHMGTPAADLLAWLGPAIGPRAFEVGPEVRQALLRPNNATCFLATADGQRYLADLYRLTRARLGECGVANVGWDADACTYQQVDRFYSYRRQGVCGRMASIIWLTRDEA